MFCRYDLNLRYHRMDAINQVDRENNSPEINQLVGVELVGLAKQRLDLAISASPNETQPPLDKAEFTRISRLLDLALENFQSPGRSSSSFAFHVSSRLEEIELLDDIPKLVGTVVGVIQKHFELTQRELAKKLGFDESFISFVIAGKSNFSGRTLLGGFDTAMELPLGTLIECVQLGIDQLSRRRAAEQSARAEKAPRTNEGT